jgi:hypothetical protein
MVHREVDEFVFRLAAAGQDRTGIHAVAYLGATEVGAHPTSHCANHWMLLPPTFGRNNSQ